MKWDNFWIFCSCVLVVLTITSLLISWERRREMADKCNSKSILSLSGGSCNLSLNVTPYFIEACDAGICRRVYFVEVS